MSKKLKPVSREEWKIVRRLSYSAFVFGIFLALAGCGLALLTMSPDLGVLPIALGFLLTGVGLTPHNALAREYERRTGRKW